MVGEEERRLLPHRASDPLREGNSTGLAAGLDRVQGHRAAQAALDRLLPPDLDGEPVSVALDDVDGTSSVERDGDQDLDLTRAFCERIQVLLQSLPLVGPRRWEQWVDER